MSLDAHYRRGAGEHPAAVDYAGRFPDLDPDWLAQALGALDPGVRSVGGYELLGKIAPSGMGVVYRAADTIFGREVAVKTLLDRFGADPGAARRLVDEARVTSQLQHPGIPAVHGLGSLPDGRPFLAMKLVRGRSLDDLLRDCPDPSADRGRFVGIFEKVCEAVAYAHSQGVVHRDLKPANVMVGEFGEVQVMDWGLAKVLRGARPAGAAGAPVETAIRTLRNPDVSATGTGSEMGTLAFIPPERATGAVDTRGDVFGLGAILCTILTGQPPSLGASAESARQLAAEARLEDAFTRLDECGAEPALVGLCKRCLSPEKASRPADAGAVAEALPGLRAEADERARRAEADRAAAKTEAREQRKRRVQLALAAALGLLVLAGGCFAWWEDRWVGRNAEALAALVTACEAALEAGDADRAAMALTEADRRVPEGGGEDVMSRLARCRADLAMLRELNQVDTFRWTPRENGYPDRTAVVARWQNAFETFGVVPGTTPEGEATARVNGSPVRRRLLLALHLWLALSPSSGVRDVLRAADPNGYRQACRDAVFASDGVRLAACAERPEALEQPAWFAAVLGEYPAVRLDRQREVMGAALRRHPGDLAVLMTLGHSYPVNQRADAEERVRWYQAAVAALPTTAAAHNGLGIALRDLGRFDAAADSFREAIRLDPKRAAAHYDLGTALQSTGDLDAAIVCFREAIRLDPKLPQPRSNLDRVLKLKAERDAKVAPPPRPVDRP
jgi:Flp pilus assembly protein TadD